MKKLIISIFLLGLIGCSGHTKYGECVGLDETDRNPQLVYKLSLRNTVVSVLFIESIIAPILYATDYAYCPVGEK